MVRCWKRSQASLEDPQCMVRISEFEKLYNVLSAFNKPVSVYQEHYTCHFYNTHPNLENS